MSAFAGAGGSAAPLTEAGIAGAGDARYIRKGTSTVLGVCFGQSNAAGYFDDASLPMPPNLWIWNSFGAGDVGSVFVPASNAPRHSWAYSAAARMARANPFVNYYIVINAVGANPVDQWVAGFQKTGTGLYDMATSLRLNVAAALAVLGKSTIDGMYAWVGESNAYNADSEAYFKGLWDQFHAQMRAQTWFPYYLPIYCMGYNPYDAAFPKYTRWMQEWCESEFQTRTFVDTSTLSVAMWTPTPHMSAEGYDAAGAMLYEATIGNVAKSPFVRYTKRGTLVPSLSFDTNGDLTASASIAGGTWTRIGSMVFGKLVLRVTPTFTTSAGTLRINGLPFTVTDAGWPCSAILSGYGALNANGQVGLYPIANSKYANLSASGFNLNWETVGAPSVTSGQEFTLLSSFMYETLDPW
jgi:hypothetical protein